MIIDGEVQLLNVIDGQFVSTDVVDGEVQLFIVDGEVDLTNSIDGDLSLLNRIDGQTSEVIRVSQNLYYQGQYNFTPTQSTQIIECAELTMTQNVTINPIPNNYGLITWNGSFLRVS